MSWGEDTKRAARRTISSQDTHFPGRFTLSQNKPLTGPCSKAEKTCGPEDKCNGLACILCAPQEKRGVASIHSPSWEQPLVHTLPGRCMELVGMAMEETGVTNWGQSAQPGIPFYPVLSSTGKAPCGPADVPRWDTGKSKPSPVPCQLSFPLPSPHRPHPSPGKPGGSSKHAVQCPPEIFGHVACELTVLSKL